MEWFNENAGILTLVVLIISLAAFAVILILLFKLHSNIAVQRLKMVGFYSKDAETREDYAEFTVSNRALNDVGISEIGLRNGKINFDLTARYKAKAEMNPSARIVIEQRSAITFRLTEEEISVVLIDTPKGKKLSSLKLYVVDLTGNVYYGNMRTVRHLLVKHIKEGSAAPHTGN